MENAEAVFVVRYAPKIMRCMKARLAGGASSSNDKAAPRAARSGTKSLEKILTSEWVSAMPRRRSGRRTPLKRSLRDRSNDGPSSRGSLCRRGRGSHSSP